MVAVGSLVNLVVTYGTQMWGFLHFGQFPLTSPSAHGRRVQAVSMTPGCLRQMPGQEDLRSSSPPCPACPGLFRLRVQSS